MYIINLLSLKRTILGVHCSCGRSLIWKYSTLMGNRIWTGVGLLRTLEPTYSKTNQGCDEFWYLGLKARIFLYFIRLLSINGTWLRPWYGTLRPWYGTFCAEARIHVAHHVQDESKGICFCLKVLWMLRPGRKCVVL